MSFNASTEKFLGYHMIVIRLDGLMRLESARRVTQEYGDYSR